MSPRSTVATTIISPNPASRVWRGRCAPRSPSIRARPMRCLRPRGRSAGDVLCRHVDRRANRNWHIWNEAMSIYTVHEPPLRAAETTPNPDRFAFVRDGFSVWAFLFAALWMLWHRMWLVLLVYVVVVLGIESALRYAGFSGPVLAIVAIFIAFLVGIESSTLRCF